MTQAAPQQSPPEYVRCKGRFSQSPALETVPSLQMQVDLFGYQLLICGDVGLKPS